MQQQNSYSFLETPQRQSPALFLHLLWKIVRHSSSFLLVFVIAYFFLPEKEDAVISREKLLLYQTLGAFGGMVLMHIPKIIGYFFHRYWIQNQELIVRSGILSKSLIVIPIDKIQSIHLSQNFLHKVTNTCSIKVDTAGSESSEMALDAVQISKAELLRDVLTNHLVNKEIDEDSPTITTKQTQSLVLYPFDLLKLAVSENHLKTAALIILFVIGKMQDAKDYLKIDSYGYAEKAGTEVANSSSTLIWALFWTALITFLISSIRVLIRYYQFQVSMEPTGFHIKWGLTEVKQKSIRFEKVALIEWHANFFRRSLDMSLIHLRTLTDNGEEDTQIQIPLTQKKQINQLIHQFFTASPLLTAAKKNIHHSYILFQSIFIGIPIALILSGIGAIWLSWNAFIIGAVFILYFSITKWVFLRKTSFAYTREGIEISKGIWGIRHQLLQWKHIQFVSINSSPFQRKRKLCTLQLHTGTEDVVIPFIYENEGRFIMDYALTTQSFISQLNSLEDEIYQSNQRLSR